MSNLKSLNNRFDLESSFIKRSDQLTPWFMIFSNLTSEELNIFLKKIDVKKLSSLMLISVLRQLYSKKDSIPYYEEYKEKCYKESLLRYGEDKSKRKFRGMIKDN